MSSFKRPFEVVPPTSSVATAPGLMIVLRMLGPASMRNPSVMALTANFVPQ